jgi:hypothetical protein
MTRLVPLLALAATLAAVLALEWAEPALPDLPPPPHAGRPRPAAAPAPAAPDEDALDELMQTVLDRPVLHPSRRPPGAPAAAAGPAGPAAAAEELPRLSGVLIGPAGRWAMFAPPAGRPLLLAEGGSVGRYTVKTIAPHAVTLTGSEGDRVIRPTLAKDASAGLPPRGERAQ